MKMAESSPKGKKHCGKRRNCSLRAISPFPTVFSKDLYWRHVKTGLVWERVKHNYQRIDFDETFFPQNVANPFMLKVYQ